MINLQDRGQIGHKTYYIPKASTIFYVEKKMSMLTELWSLKCHR